MLINDSQRTAASAGPNVVAAENRRARLVAAALDGDRQLDPGLFALLQSELGAPSAAPKRAPWLLSVPLSAAAIVGLRSLQRARSPLRFDLAALPPRAWLGYGVLCACVAGAMFTSSHRGRNGFALPAVVLQLLAWLLLGLAALTPFLTAGVEPQPLLHALGAPCAYVIATCGACALVVFAIMHRRAQPIAPRAHAALFGAATAAWGGLVISLYCPGESVQHLVWGHSLPIALLLPAAVLTLPRFLRP